MAESQPVIEASGLTVFYGKGPKRVRAVDNISFQVQPGECVGFIGANGAGKSTTMKTLMGFLFPARGTVSLFGEPCGTAESRRRVGYLPEVALYYPFMKARELLELYGGLHGLDRRQLKERIPVMLERVGLAGKGEILLKNFSKGMQQRLGIAQAIIADPELLIFDELSSGLDPLGRHDLRDVLLELKSQGRTIFFSSHELTEVETLCDRLIMIHEGRIVAEAPVSELMKPLNVFEVVFTLRDGAELPASIAKLDPAKEETGWRLELHEAPLYSKVIGEIVAAGGTIVRSSSKSRSLEEFFIELVKGEGEKPACMPPG